MGMAFNSNSEVEKKLDRVLQLLAVVAVRDMPQTMQIATLNRAGFAPREIADVLGTTANTVRVALVGIRRTEARGGRRRMKMKLGTGGTKDDA
jgi:DNA-binding NarL/FixJ family response regulator